MEGVEAERPETVRDWWVSQLLDVANGKDSTASHGMCI